MSKRIRLAIAVALAVAVGIYALAWAQNVTPSQQVTPTQINFPGNPYTLQTAFCQTSTGGAQANTITVAALSGKTIYVTGFEISGDGATTDIVVTCTLAFAGTTVANYSVVTGAVATKAQVDYKVEYVTPIVAPGAGQNCVLTVPTFGSGNTDCSVTLHGFYQ